MKTTKPDTTYNFSNQPEPFFKTSRHISLTLNLRTQNFVVSHKNQEKK